MTNPFRCYRLSRLTLLALVLGLALAVTLAATDGPLTPSGNLRVRTDENGYLRISAGTPGLTDGPLTVWSNLRTRTDENGYLRVSCADCGGGGTISGSIASTQVAFGTGADEIGGEAAFTYNSTTNVLSTTGGYSDGTNYLLKWSAGDSALAFRNAADSAAVPMTLPGNVKIQVANVSGEDYLLFLANGNQSIRVGGTGAALSNDDVFGFSSGAIGSGNPDSGIGRNAAGIIETNTGTLGTIGTLRSKYKSSDNSTGVTVITCTSFKDGICVAGT